MAGPTVEAGSSWAELGAGPMKVQALNGQVYLQISSGAPTAGSGGFVLRPEYGIQDFNTTSNLWVMSAEEGAADVTVAFSSVTA